MRARLTVSTLLLLAVSGVCTAQAPAGEDRYKLLATTRTSTMEKEVNDAAAQGYRILVGSPTSGTEMALFMERVATPTAPYKYRLLATDRTGTMQRELNQAAEGGYRLMPSTIIAKRSALSGSAEIVLLVELAPSVARQYEYKLLATSRTSTLQKETAEAQAAGFVIVGMVSRGEHMVILERETAK
jgi:hypothetical protein